MHILKIIHGYPPLYNAGSEVYSQSICNELGKRHRVTVFTREENPFAPDFSIRKETLAPRIDAYFVNMPRSKDGYRHRPLDGAFAELVGQLRPDIAHIGHLNHLSTGLVDVLNALGIPIVFTLHDFWLMCPRGQFLQRNFDGRRVHELCQGQEDRKCATACYGMYHSGNRLGSDAEYWADWVRERMAETSAIIAKTDLFLAPSHYLMGRFVTGFKVPPAKIRYLDYGFPLHYLLPSKKRKASPRFKVGYIGTLIPAKGVNLLIGAFKKVRVPAELKIWGHKDAQSYQALKALAQGAPNPVSFGGGYDNADLAKEIFPQVDCIVVPSIWAENSPLVIHEAQACHVPVITADFGGMAEYVMHRENGLLFRHRDAESLAEQLEWAIGHPEEMEAYGRRGYLHHPEGQVPDIVAHCRTLEEIYHSILTRHGKRILEDHH